MPARPCPIDARAIDDFWADVGRWLDVHSRTWAWLADRLGIDRGALSRMRHQQQVTPLDVYWSVVAELGPGVGRAAAERAGVDLVPAALDRPSTAAADAHEIVVSLCRSAAVLTEGLSDGRLSPAEIDAWRPQAEALISSLQDLLARHRGPVALAGGGR